MKKILAILAAAFGALFFACAPVVNGSAGFTAGTMPYKPNKNDK